MPAVIRRASSPASPILADPPWFRKPAGAALGRVNLALARQRQRRRFEQLNVVASLVGPIPHQSVNFTVIVPAGLWWQ